jgi:large subunit ribosomal protein L5
MNRLKDKYANDVVPALRKEFGYTNIMAVPRIEKVVVNMGLGEATSNVKIIDTGTDEVARVTGQKPLVRRAKKSIAQFKVRQGQPIGVMVTLRGERMWEFIDRLISIALPRVRDFKGVSPKGFDGRGNYTLGLRDQLLFPEIDYMKVDKARGMNVSLVTTAKTDEEARKLLQFIGMPFRQ